MKDVKLGKIIHNGRERMGITRSELARLMEVSPAAVTYWENGTNFPSGPCLIDLLRKLNIVQDIFPEYFAYQIQQSPGVLWSNVVENKKTVEERLLALEHALGNKP